MGSDDNSGPDGKNAELTFTAGTSGTYFVRVLSTNSRGEYVLGVAGATGGLPAFAVSAVDPPDGYRTRVVPAQMTVHFNDGVLLTSLDASDLTVASIT